MPFCASVYTDPLRVRGRYVVSTTFYHITVSIQLCTTIDGPCPCSSSTTTSWDPSAYILPGKCWIHTLMSVNYREAVLWSPQVSRISTPTIDLPCLVIHSLLTTSIGVVLITQNRPNQARALFSTLICDSGTRQVCPSSLCYRTIFLGI
jgi:hypothetical protein